jgi:protein-S-isoprenylcysteine O-methyltransferase Ste14
MFREQASMSLRYFLPIYLVVYVIVAFVWRRYVVWKKTGFNPVVFKGSNNAHDFIGQVFKLVFAVVVIVVLVYSFFPGAYHYLVPVSWLEGQWIRFIGVAILIGSLLWTIMAQVRMGESWRMGIASEHKTKLVQTGVFRISRNPIYIGVIMTLLGLFLVIPNAITLLILILGVVVINIQVRLEEEYLKTAHGAEYVSYTERVRRWI